MASEVLIKKLKNMDLKTEIQNRLNDITLALDTVHIMDHISIERHQARVEELQWVLSLLQPKTCKEGHKTFCYHPDNSCQECSTQNEAQPSREAEPKND